MTKPASILFLLDRDRMMRKEAVQKMRSDIANGLLNMKQRKDAFWFFKSGISNVVRTGGENCLIHITYKRPNLLYTLEFDATHTNSQQLNNLRHRKELTDKLNEINAKLEVHELKTKTTFLLTIPIHR